MKVFITGATGFVGSHVAQELSRRGADLRILIRPTSKLENLAGLPAETVTGDLCRSDALRSAISGCDAVMHVAADYRLWVTDPEKMHATNVAGTRELLRIAREAGRPPRGLHLERRHHGIFLRRTPRRTRRRRSRSTNMIGAL